MVAEAEPKISTRKPSPRRGHLIPKISLLTRTQARNLYVLNQVGAAEVATQTGLTVKQVYSLADREGWTKQRKEIKGKSIEAQNARMSADCEAHVEAAAMESSELVLSTFTKAKEAIAKGGPMAAKDVQAWSQATKNYVGIYRQAKSLDVSASSGEGATLNVMFVGALPKSAERITRNVTPSVSPCDPSVALPAGQQTVDVSSTQGAASVQQQ